MSAMQSIAAAQAAAERGAYFQAMDLLREALRSPERLGEGWARALMIATRLVDDDAALAAARRLYAETPVTMITTFVLARALEETGRSDEGAKLLAPYVQAGQLPPGDLFKFAWMLLAAGFAREAEQCMRALLRSQPSNGHYWERLSFAKKFAAGDPDISAMERVRESSARMAPEYRAAIAYALAKAYVDIGDDAKTAERLQEAAAAQLLATPFDIDLIERLEADALATFASPGQDAGAAGSERVVFVLGPQRSGTTLVEQVIASHPDMKAGGELKYLWMLTGEVNGLSPANVAAYEAKAGAGVWREIGERYLKFADERFGAGARFTDKLLSNHYAIGLIRRALPNAHIVRVQRDPLEIAWSCWRTHFNAPAGWSCSPDALARYIASYERIMDAWSDRGAIHQVNYKNLVTDPNTEIPRLLQACGLSDHPATRRPQDLKRAVTTSSFAQVRAPISAGSLGGAERFPIATAPLRAALRKVGL